MIRNRADFEVTGRSGGTVALIEVKNVPRLVASSAADLRRGLLEEDPANLPLAYFLVVSQDQAFLWEPEQGGDSDSPPAAAFPMRQILGEYLSDGVLDQHLRALNWVLPFCNG